MLGRRKKFASKANFAFPGGAEIILGSMSL
jgi:hypothetical protein